ncbi:hypothetical protein PAPYR_10898 [Paratrimastix pyriformis]|uniref:Uncharacterized protein n=1 Tax=Paratrimastix pyriformis TaxID=342808 RepID=A0ABQ8UAR4_9EUKA|nr:hypothetical protein PAPYR_10898 [Paratrimastix pyriformis]
MRDVSSCEEGRRHPRRPPDEQTWLHSKPAHGRPARHHAALGDRHHRQVVCSGVAATTGHKQGGLFLEQPQRSPPGSPPSHSRAKVALAVAAVQPIGLLASRAVRPSGAGRSAEPEGGCTVYEHFDPATGPATAQPSSHSFGPASPPWGMGNEVSAGGWADPWVTRRACGPATSGSNRASQYRSLVKEHHPGSVAPSQRTANALRLAMAGQR